MPTAHGTIQEPVHADLYSVWDSGSVIGMDLMMTQMMKRLLRLMRMRMLLLLLMLMLMLMLMRKSESKPLTRSCSFLILLTVNHSFVE